MKDNKLESVKIDQAMVFDSKAGAASDLESLIDVTDSLNRRELPLSLNRSLGIERTEEGDRITICSPANQVELEIVLTANGPILRFNSADLQLKSTGKVMVDCEDFHVKARGTIIQESDGDMTHRSKEQLSIVGKACSVCSRRGDVNLTANDDVRVKGERILLNC